MVIQRLELALEGISRILQQMVGAKVGAPPKTLGQPFPPPPARRGPKAALGPTQRPATKVEIDGLEVVESALAAGVPIEHLKEMGIVLGSSPRAAKGL